MEAKLIKLWSKVRQSPNAREGCKRILEGILLLSNVTRRNSELDALDDAMKAPGKINELLLHLRLPTLFGEDVNVA